MHRPTSLSRSRTKPSVASIPARAVLTNERLYTRARLLSLAKQHNISTAQKSRTALIEDLLKKQLVLETEAQAASSAEIGPSNQRRMALSRDTRMSADDPCEPHTPEKAESSITPLAPQALRIRRQPSVEFVPILPEQVNTSTPMSSPAELKTPNNEPRGGHEHDSGSGSGTIDSSPVRGKFLHYRRRFATALRGLTPSPAGSPTTTSIPSQVVSHQGDIGKSLQTSSGVSVGRVFRRRAGTPPPQGARRSAALEPLSEEEDVDDIVSLVTGDSPSLGNSSYTSGGSSHSSAEMEDSSPLRLVNNTEFCPDWSVFDYPLEETEEVNSTLAQDCFDEEVPKVELWTSTGGLNLNAVPSVVRGGWNWDDITERLKTSDFR